MFQRLYRGTKTHTHAKYEYVIGKIGQLVDDS